MLNIYDFYGRRTRVCAAHPRRTRSDRIFAMRITFADQMDTVDIAAWNSLLRGNNPFVRHEFLSALEHHGAVGGDSGWEPCHVLAWQDDALVGALPLYLKQHSWGEFVFDWSWAEAYHRAGQAYYPKLVAASPYSPCTGPRLLVADTPQRDTVCETLIHAATAFAVERGASSVHCLFPDERQIGLFERRGFHTRIGCQYHWHNRGYRDFDDYLSHFTAEKRKKIKRERRRVVEAGVEIEILRGADIGRAEWRAFYRFYCSTFLQKSGYVPLRIGLFEELGARLPDQVVMVMARHRGDYVAAALSLRSDDTLYGRYWGASEQFHSLHFEACYYSGVDYCISHGLARFEPGAQGEHKISRGFAPTATYSAHWLRDPRFDKAIARHLDEERRHMRYHMMELSTHLPYKSADDAATIQGGD